LAAVVLLPALAAGTTTGGRLEISYQDLKSSLTHSASSSQILDGHFTESLSSRSRLTGRMNLSFYQDPLRGNRLTRSRFMMGLASPDLSFDARFEPRQRTSLGAEGGTEQQLWSYSVQATPDRLPSLRLTHTRSDEFNSSADAHTKKNTDTQLGLAHTVYGLRMSADRRWLKARDLLDESVRELFETRAGAQASPSPFSWISTNLSYNFVESEQDPDSPRGEVTRIHNAGGSLQARLPGHITASGNYLYRSTSTDGPPDLGENGHLGLIDRDVTGRLAFSPARWFSLRAVRERRTSSGVMGGGVSDYGQGQATVDVPVLGLSRAWATVSRVWVFETTRATTPTSNVVMGFQGPVWRDLSLRAHLDYGYSSEEREGQATRRTAATFEARFKPRERWEVRGEVQTTSVGDEFRIRQADRSVVRADVTRRFRSGGMILTTYQRTLTRRPATIRDDRVSFTGNFSSRAGHSFSMNYIATWPAEAFSQSPNTQAVSVQGFVSLSRKSTVSLVHQRTESERGSENRSWSVHLTRKL
jgi:hypothetical protein